MDIKDMLDTKQVIEYYGFTINRAGFISCPFHTEKTASLKVYAGKRGWNCFGCGQYGSVIDFVMKLFGIDYKQALSRLNYDFNLGIARKLPDKRSLMRLNRERIRKQKEQMLRELMYEYRMLDFKKHRLLMELHRPTILHTEITNEFAMALIHMNNAEIWLQER